MTTRQQAPAGRTGSHARPPVSRVWDAETVIADGLVGDDLTDCLREHPGATAWWVIPRGDADALTRMESALQLDRISIREVSADDHRAKFEELPSSRLVITNVVDLDHDSAEVTTDAVSMVTTDRVLVVVADRTNALDAGGLLAASQQRLSIGGVHAALVVIMQAVIGSYERAVDWLEEASDTLSEALFEERPFAKNEQIWAFRLRSALTQVRRTTEPMRDVVDAIDTATDGTPVARIWAVTAERHHRVAGAANALREALSSAFDTSLALSDLRMNQVMKKLTAWAAIVAVPTLVTGFAGMNVSFPLDGTTAGFWVTTVIMVVCVVLLYAMFKRNDWI